MKKLGWPLISGLGSGGFIGLCVFGFQFVQQERFHALDAMINSAISGAGSGMIVTGIVSAAVRSEQGPKPAVVEGDGKPTITDRPHPTPITFPKQELDDTQLLDQVIGHLDRVKVTPDQLRATVQYILTVNPCTPDQATRLMEAAVSFYNAGSPEVERPARHESPRQEEEFSLPGASLQETPPIDIPLPLEPLQDLWKEDEPEPSPEPQSVVYHPEPKPKPSEFGGRIPL